MNEQGITKLADLPYTDQATGPLPEQVQAALLQEHFNGTLPCRNERTAADVLAERLSESDSSVMPVLFIP